MRILGVAMGLALVMVGGCNGQSDPSGADASSVREVAIVPPGSRHTPGVAARGGAVPSEQALTAEPPAAEGAAPESATASVEPTPQPRGTATAPPRMPTVASKRTQAGAEAFVRHWIASLDHVYQGAQPDLVMTLSGPECLSCPALVDGIPGNPGRERTFEVLGVSGLLFGDELARVEAQVEVLRGDGKGVGVLVFDLSAGSGGWVVDSIRLQQRP